MTNVSIQPLFRLVGNYDPSRKYQAGDIVVKGDEVHTYIDGSWLNIGDSIEAKLHDSLRPKICSRCGAPLTGSRCAYCETQYLNF